MCSLPLTEMLCQCYNIAIKWTALIIVISWTNIYFVLVYSLLLFTVCLGDKIYAYVEEHLTSIETFHCTKASL